MLKRTTTLRENGYWYQRFVNSFQYSRKANRSCRDLLGLRVAGWTEGVCTSGSLAAAAIDCRSFVLDAPAKFETSRRSRTPCV